VRVRFQLNRIRPAELLALIGAVILAAALFLPWYEFPAGRENAWNALTFTEFPAAAAALSALALVLITVRQRSPALPVALAVLTTLLGLVSVVVVGLRSLALPGAALDRCYGLWVGLGGSVLVLIAGWLSMRDERPFWGVRANGLPGR
jgi:hypothetical protein